MQKTFGMQHGKGMNGAGGLQGRVIGVSTAVVPVAPGVLMSLRPCIYSIPTATTATATAITTTTTTITTTITTELR